MSKTPAKDEFKVGDHVEWNSEAGRVRGTIKKKVIAPIGAGMLGYRVGDEFEWNVPGGIRRMKVAKVHYQPEAAGDFTR